MHFTKLTNSINFLLQKPTSFNYIHRLISTLPKKTEFFIDPIAERELFKNTKDGRKKTFGLTNFKHNAGRNTLAEIKLPTELNESIENVIQSFPQTNLLEDAKVLTNKLVNRRIPIEKNEKKKIKEDIMENFKNDDRIFDPEFIENKLEGEIETKLKSKIRPWKKIDFSHRTAMLYLISRFEPEYSTVFQVLAEIKSKDTEFSPRNVFDFGSGLGTVMWATDSLWESQVKEYFNCDISRQMNTLAELITKGGSISNPSKFKNATFKLNISKSSENEFDLVTSSYSLFELPNKISRFEILENLWRKVKPNGYLVLIEEGSHHGFKLISEARDYMLEELENDLEEDSDQKMQIFSPCPHELTCPILKEGRSCKFTANYWPLNIQKNNKVFNKQSTRYSYLVLKKSAAEKPDYQKWPRLVIRNPVKHGNVTHSWLCNSDGSLDHLVATSKRCIKTSRLVKYSKVGDNLPLTYTKPEPELEPKNAEL